MACLLGLVLGLLLTTGVGTAAAFGTAPGYAATNFVTGIPNNGSVGPVGLAFDPASPTTLYMMDYATGVLYRFGPGGGPADFAHAVNPFSPIPCAPAGIAFDKTGRLFVAEQACGRVMEIDKNTGAELHFVAGVPCATGIATDPLSGDLLATNPCGAPGIFRIANHNTAPVATPYAPGLNNVDGITFGPDGTIYAAVYGVNLTSVAGTNKPQPAAFSPIVNLSLSDGVGVAANTADPSNPAFLFANRNNGIITKVDLTHSPPTLTDIFFGGSRGDFVTVGGDGCLYATQTNTVVRLTNDDGTCSLAPVTPADPTALTLEPPLSGDHGDAVNLRAHLVDIHTATDVAGKSVTLTVDGHACTATTNASGIATCPFTPSEPAGTYAYTASYAGELTLAPANASGTFTVTHEEATLQYTGVTGTVHPGQAVGLSAVLLEDGATPIAGRTVTFAFGGSGCSAPTDASGTASCVVVVAEPHGPVAITASFAGDGFYVPASDSATATVAAPTTVTWLGPVTGDYNDAVAEQARLVDADSGLPLSGEVVSITVGADTCAALTDTAGIATCTITPSGPAGAAPVTVSFAGDGTWDPSSDAGTFTVTREETTLTYTGGSNFASGATATLSAVLREDGVGGIAGRSVTLTLGTASCTATTTASGTAWCTATVPAALGPGVATASFAGDGYYVPAADSAPVLVYAGLGSGAFVVADGTVGHAVTFWGSTWTSANPLAPTATASFKGFAAVGAGTCGGTWTTSPGNSSGPPASVASYAAMIVTGPVTKSGSTISGTILHVVVVRTNAGYDANPGHAGTGTVVATIC